MGRLGMPRRWTAIWLPAFALWIYACAGCQRPPMQPTGPPVLLAVPQAAWPCQPGPRFAAPMVSPDVVIRDGMQDSTAIQRTDAQWCFPPPSVHPAGTRHALTTRLWRQSDRAPIAGWLVRYEILDGPAAGFSPDGATVVEVTSDSSGQASVEIFQQQPTPGTNRIGIQVIRPETLGGQRVVVGNGSTLKTWSATEMPRISLRKTGPAVAGVGAALNYTIELTNPGGLAAEGLVLSDEIPEALDYVGSDPPAEVSGRSLRWSVATISAGATLRFQVNLRAARAGSVTSCAEAVGSGGLQARDCVTTNIAAPRLDVRVTGPERATVGEQVVFEIVVTNAGDGTATGLVVRDVFDAGLKHAEAVSPIERSLGEDLAPGQSKTLGVEFQVVQPGRLCQTITISGDGGIQNSRQACLVAAEAAKPQPVPQPQPQPVPKQPPTQPEPQPGPKPQPKSEPQPSPGKVTARVAGPPGPLNVGQIAEFVVEVTNSGQQALSNVRVELLPDGAFEPVRASVGAQQEGAAVFWTIANLVPGAKEEFQLNCTCAQPAPSACLTARVTSQEGAEVRDQQCLAIRQPTVVAPGTLRMTVADLSDPVPKGQGLTYVVSVTNVGDRADRNLTLRVVVPPELTAVRLQTTGPQGVQSIEGSIVRFNPAPNLLPGETIVYRVRVQTKQAGEVRLKAELTSQNVRDPLTVETTTKIIAE